MSTVQQAGPVYALLVDRSTVEIRPAEPRDFDAVKAMHEAMWERHAGVASLRQVFAPESVAVIGASRRPGTVGRVIWDNICTGGYAGRHGRRTPDSKARGYTHR